MTFPFAGLGWTDETPTGVRLRWRFPIEDLGPPRLLAIERAPLESWDLDLKPGQPASDYVPYDWWEQHGNVNLYDVPPLIHNFAEPVDAIRFVIQGDARMLAVDEAGRIVEDRMVNDGEDVRIDRGRIVLLGFLGFGVELLKLRTLDLSGDHGLHWQEIARIAVNDPLRGPYADVAARLQDNPVDAVMWSELGGLLADAEAGPAAWTDGPPTPWEAIEAALGVRWAYAVAAGFAYVDGPDHSQAPVDEVFADEALKQPPPGPLVYRAREIDADGRPPLTSVAAVVPPGIAPALVSPSAPIYESGTVRLRQRDGRFEARATVSWQQQDARAIGVVLREEVSPSAVLGQPAATESVECRSRRPEDLPGTASLLRNRDVAFHDVTIHARAIAIDGWDRSSPPTPFGPAASLDLLHTPTPPVLGSAHWSGGTVRLDAVPPQPGELLWAPDEIVLRANGELVVYRRLRGPNRASVTVGSPVPLGDGSYDVPVTGAPTGTTFTEGRLIVGGRIFSITSERPGWLTVLIPCSANGTGATFGAGPATAVEDDSKPAAWTEVHAVQASTFAGSFVFTETLPIASSGSDVLTYALRVRFLGRTGPLGNPVSTYRIVDPPPSPPPFSVQLLDVDHYNRTLVEVTLTTPNAGEHRVAWARGSLTAAAFSLKAALGDLGPQEPHADQLLYEVFPLPIPRSVAETVTIGVARLGPAATQSAYETVAISIPPPPP